MNSPQPGDHVADRVGMWDTIAEMTEHDTVSLSRDLPCQRCGHESHRYVGCDSGHGCDCPASPLPGDVAVPQQR